MKKLIITCVLLSSVGVVSYAQSSNTATSQTLSMQAQNNAPNNKSANIPYNQMTPEQKEEKQKASAERQAQYFQKQYDLNAMQYKGVYDACLQYVKDNQAFRDNGKQPNQAEAIQLRDARDAKFKEIMTPEQYTKFAATMHKTMPQTGAPQQQSQQPAGNK